MLLNTLNYNIINSLSKKNALQAGVLEFTWYAINMQCIYKVHSIFFLWKERLNKFFQTGVSLFCQSLTPFCKSQNITYQRCHLLADFHIQLFIFSFLQILLHTHYHAQLNLSLIHLLYDVQINNTVGKHPTIKSMTFIMLKHI